MSANLGELVLWIFLGRWRVAPGFLASRPNGSPRQASCGNTELGQQPLGHHQVHSQEQNKGQPGWHAASKYLLCACASLFAKSKQKHGRLRGDRLGLKSDSLRHAKKWNFFPRRAYQACVEHT
jgi:hypothetical protein